MPEHLVPQYFGYIVLNKTHFGCQKTLEVDSFPLPPKNVNLDLDFRFELGYVHIEPLAIAVQKWPSLAMFAIARSSV